MSKKEWIQATVHCPNCGEIVTGYRDKAGCAKMQCINCQANVVAKQMSRRHERIDLFAPNGQIALN